jgi:hypothetical protein
MPDPTPTSAPTKTIEQHCFDRGLTRPCPVCRGKKRVIVRKPGAKGKGSGKIERDCGTCLPAAKGAAGGFARTGVVYSWHLPVLKAFKGWGIGQLVTDADFDAAFKALLSIRVGGGSRGHGILIKRPPPAVPPAPKAAPPAAAAAPTTK